MRLGVGALLARFRVLLLGSRRARVERTRAWVRVLEDYQRDLEQAAADVANVIRRLREDLGQATSERV
jgi:hypothetical protein